MKTWAPQIYQERRQRLCEQVGSGLILLPGNGDSPANFKANCYPFRQDSTFLYFFGLDSPNLVGLLDAESGEGVLFGDDPDADHVIWTYPTPPLASQAEAVGMASVKPLRELEDVVGRLGSGRAIHLAPLYRFDQRALISRVVEKVGDDASEPLIRAIVRQRSVKSPEEVAQIERALAISLEMHREVQKVIRPGIKEEALVAASEAVAQARGSRTSFQTIMTVRGEILHNPRYDNVLEVGQLLVHDSGAESELGYASDITTTLSVDGEWNEDQVFLRDTVERARNEATKACRPGVMFRDVHALAAKELLRGLKELGLVLGNLDDAVEEDVHTLFFPCGLGHMLGLDVHDMEALGEDFVGYTNECRRQDRFGWRNLRLGKALKKDYVITVEPGIYFNPVLMDRWQAAGKADSFLDYERLSAFRHFGGIRLEQDVLITQEGARVLGSQDEIDALR